MSNLFAAFSGARPLHVRGLAPRLALSGMVLALGACTLGPNYRDAPPTAQDTLKAGVFKRAPDQGVSNAPGVAQWWTALGDPELDSLIETALANNPDIQASEARLRTSRASLTKAQDNALPKVAANAAALRTQRPSELDTTGSGPLKFYTAGFDATWEIDLFGGTRRAVEAAGAQAQSVEANLADAHVSLAAEVAQAYVNLRAQQQRAVIGHQSAEYEEQILKLTQQRRERGTASEADVERSRTQVGTTRASLTPIDADVSESLDRLAVLCGMEPGALDARLSKTGPLPTLPATVAIGDPAALLKRRPDIRAAERKLASATAQIGENQADYFPKVTLYGDLGFSATTPGGLFRRSSSSWLGVPYLSWNVFDFGRTRAAVRTAEAQRDEAVANYQSTV
ncbi:MAG: efflux transporter outer membrane subunit, partial [Janthinobacterium lividum]